METTLKIGKDYVDILKDLVKESDIKTQKEYVETMILYFKETGINPKVKSRSTADEISKLRNTVISFIREQEKKKLDPIISTLNETLDYLRNYYKNEAVTKDDIKALVATKSQAPAPVIRKEPEPASQLANDEKYQNLVKHTKGLFSEFIKNFKSSTFGGYSVDKAILERYKALFEKL
jgi:hypothetical protein